MLSVLSVDLSLTITHLKGFIVCERTDSIVFEMYCSSFLEAVIKTNCGFIYVSPNLFVPWKNETDHKKSI